MVGRQVELGLLPVEAEGEPYLSLAFPAAGQFPRHQGREIVGEPAVGADEVGDAGRARLLLQLPARRVLQGLAVVDAPLRELPVVRRRRAGPAAEPDPPIGMEQHHADVRSVFGKVGHFLTVRAEAGASWKPLCSTSFAQDATFTSVTG